MLARTTRNPLNARLTRSLSSRASAVLGALDLPTTGTPEVAGVYDGAWGGSGDVLESRCPATGEVLAHVKTVSTPLLSIVYQRFNGTDGVARLHRRNFAQSWTRLAKPMSTSATYQLRKGAKYSGRSVKLLQPRYGCCFLFPNRVWY
jgi:hypothetical protein